MPTPTSGAESKRAARSAALPGSFMKSLFAGALPADMVFPYPRQDAEARETLDLVLESFRSWARERLDGGAIDRAAAFPETQVRELKELGILGLTIPEEYGGAGLSITAYCRLMEEIGHHCAAIATIVGAHLGIGSKGIVHYGSDAQKKRWLPGVAKGDPLCAYALTEAGSGSDAASLKTRAVWNETRQAWNAACQAGQGAGEPGGGNRRPETPGIGQDRGQRGAHQTVEERPPIGPLDMHAGMVDEVHVVHPGRAGGHAGEAREAAVDVLDDFGARRPLVLQHVLDQVDAPARAVELVAEQHIGRAGRGAETAMHAAAQDRLRFGDLRIGELGEREPGLHRVQERGRRKVKRMTTAWKPSMRVRRPPDE